MKIPTFSGLRQDPDVEKQGGIFGKGEGIFARNPTDSKCLFAYLIPTVISFESGLGFTVTIRQSATAPSKLHVVLLVHKGYLKLDSVEIDIR